MHDDRTDARLSRLIELVRSPGWKELDVEQRRVLAQHIVATLREIGFACELIGADANCAAPAPGTGHSYSRPLVFSADDARRDRDP